MLLPRLVPVAGAAFGMNLLSLIVLAVAVSAYKPLSDSFLRIVPSGGVDFDISNGSLLSPLLVPRVPGTPGQAQVQKHLVGFFRTELPHWTIEWQNSTSKTPTSNGNDVPFANLIFGRQPPWTKPGQANMLTLAAHYDSRSMPSGFVGATDSAASSAMLLHVARTLDKYIQQMYDEMQALGEGGTVAMDMGVQIVFLDGKEGFGSEVTEGDSLYGSRSLAATWEATTNPAMASYGYPNPLNQISIFLLLDLLGAPNPTVNSYFQTSHWAYRSMNAIESRMRKLSLLETNPPTQFLPDTGRTDFGTSSPRNDHVPFMDKGVPVLNVVPSTMPLVWQMAEDDGAHLDLPTVRDWSKIVTAFALEWLDMMEVDPTAQQRRRR